MQSHPNGDSVDSAYLNALANEQLKVDAFNDLYFENTYKGLCYQFVNRQQVVTIAWLPNLNNATGISGHEDHLHAGGFLSARMATLSE